MPQGPMKMRFIFLTANSDIFTFNLIWIKSKCEYSCFFTSIIKIRKDNEKKQALEADHVPPKIIFKKVYQMFRKPENTGQESNLQTIHPKLHKMISESGNEGLCRESLKSDHIEGLTWGNVKECIKIRWEKIYWYWS